MNNYDNVIAAISTSYATAAISVIRVSGNNCLNILSNIFSNKNINKILPRTTVFTHIISKDNFIIDDCILVSYKAPLSFTGEDMLEINIHGGILVTQKVLLRILEEDVRLASPGEFTLRAYLNNKLSLIEAESINDIINAKNEIALKIATNGLHKGTLNITSTLKNQILDILSKIEVQIDYPEYEEFKDFSKNIINNEIKPLIEYVSTLLIKSNKTMLIKEGFPVAIIGAPNTGKSSLLNLLLDKNKAIVTSIPGTTRDLIEDSINLKGLTINFIDTAGIRNTVDEIEKIGITKTKEVINKAVLLLVVIDSCVSITKEDKEILKLVKNKDFIIVNNKIDIGTKSNSNNYINISTVTKEGLKELEDAITSKLKFNEITSDFNYFSNIRQIDLLENIKKTLEEINVYDNIGILAYNIGRVLKYILELSGEEYNELLTSSIFSKFCVGK
ncbi:MAG: tRNA uridine-5-carboxymethylaminomethyl(34) synthesis GTPase MnmE [Acholeplasmatales bacterium]|jgi:tRNA modification GTPase|nr:tRNA uridine-5-carboxymethylaminomethyl(34) synthesis GTPase MnmE [Acholeplasmatales bacterium]